MGRRFEPTHGPPGTIIAFSGTTLRGEDGRWAPSDRLEAWWNTVAPSRGIQLLRIDDMEGCRFETTFAVPDVTPGRYKISVYAWDADPMRVIGLFLSHHSLSPRTNLVFVAEVAARRPDRGGIEQARLRTGSEQIIDSSEVMTPAKYSKVPSEHCRSVGVCPI